MAELKDQNQKMQAALEEERGKLNKRSQEVSER